MSADASVNNAERLADYWVFGGIFRPVYLEAMPAQFIDYVGIDAKADGKFAMQVWTKGLAQNTFIITTLTDANKNVVGYVKTPISKSNENTVVNLQAQSVKSWTSETPVLYNAQVVLLDAAGKRLYELNEKFGFRTIEIRKG